MNANIVPLCQYNICNTNTLYLLKVFFFYRFTPTSAGPNSFGKTKYGFIDTKKVFEKNLKEAALQINEEEKKAKKKIQ